MKKVLVIYFSLTGTTRNVAQSISDLINADIYQIEAEHPYTRADLDWTIADSRANREQNTEIARPAYKENYQMYHVMIRLLLVIRFGGGFHQRLFIRFWMILI